MRVCLRIGRTRTFSGAHAPRVCVGSQSGFRFFSVAEGLPDADALGRAELGKRAHREVQVARRRRREADDETVLFQSANAAGFTLCSDKEGQDDAAVAIERRGVISRFVTSRAEQIMEVVAAGKPLDEVIDFSLEVKPTDNLPQPIAGDGVFIQHAGQDEVPAGTVVAFYPGAVYMPHEVRWLGGHGALMERAGQRTSSHVIGRAGGVLIDGLWSGLPVPSSEFSMDDATLEKVVADRLERESVDSDVGRQAARNDMELFRGGLTSEGRSSAATVLVPDHAGDRAMVRKMNPLAVGEMINHPPDGRPANVIGWPVDLDLFSEGKDALARAAPNTYGLRPEGVPAPGSPCPYTVVMLTAVPLKPGDELWLDYGCELLDVEDIPVWFAPAALRGDSETKATSKSPAFAIRDELHAWRDSFEATHGRKPSRQEMLADPAAAALFETFQTYRKLGDL